MSTKYAKIRRNAQFWGLVFLLLVVLTIFIDLIYSRYHKPGIRDLGTGNRVQGSGSREQGSGHRDQGTGIRDQAT